MLGTLFMFSEPVGALDDGTLASLSASIHFATLHVTSSFLSTPCMCVQIMFNAFSLWSWEASRRHHRH